MNTNGQFNLNVQNRELPSTHKRIFLGGKQLVLENTDPYFDSLPSKYFIRIREDEYPFLPRIDGVDSVGGTDGVDGEISLNILYTHFNLSPAFHIPGLTYMMPRILETGYCDGEKEVLPLISLDNAYIAECIGFETLRRYEDLVSDDFTYAASNIKNAEDLKRIIVSKYSKSMPTLSEEEILAKGVSLTKLRIIGSYDSGK